MAIWKEQPAPPKEPAVSSAEPSPKKEYEPRIEFQPTPAPQARAPERAVKESLIAEQLTIEGKIEGAGHVRIAGRFKGDVHVKGNLAIEPGATVTGGVRANTVTIGGELEGNIEGAGRVELLETGVLNGDLSADSLTVAAGSRMRGKVEFGWEGKGGRAPERAAERGASSSSRKLEAEARKFDSDIRKLETDAAL
jgi:cytoskeletal protein CcmA (bactofilin family)